MVIFFLTDVDRHGHIFELLLYIHVFSEQNCHFPFATYNMDLSMTCLIAFGLLRARYPCHCMILRVTLLGIRDLHSFKV
jgi:hypothetical protein